MPKYASFDHTAPAPQMVLGWYDTDLLVYPNLPPPEDLLQLTEEQFTDHPLSACVIEDGAIVVLPPPPPDPGQAADAELALHRQDGIAVTSTATPSLNATYSLRPDDIQLVGAIARDAASGMGLPSGAATVPIRDLEGVAHDFPEADVIALYKAARDLVVAMSAQRDVMAGGGTPVWPPQTATIP